MSYYSIKEHTNMINMDNLIGTMVICAWETLIIINAAVKDPISFHTWSVNCLKAMHIPYTGVCGTAYCRIYTVFSQQAARKE